MVLQRWQTVYLLVAIAAMIVFLLNPVTAGEDSGLPGSVWIAVAGWVNVALAAWAVASFRRLGLQKCLAAVSGVMSLLLGLAVVGLGLLVCKATLLWTAYLPLVAAVAAWRGFLAIRRDQRVIESADRLWD